MDGLPHSDESVIQSQIPLQMPPFINKWERASPCWRDYQRAEAWDGPRTADGSSHFWRGLEMTAYRWARQRRRLPGVPSVPGICRASAVKEQ